MADTVDDAVRIPETKPVEKKPEGVDGKQPVNVNTILAVVSIASLVLAGVSGYNSLVIQNDRTDQRGINTEAEVKELKPMVARIPTMEVKIGYIDDSVKRIEGKLDKVLEARK